MSGAKLNRQPGPLNEDALSLLRENGLRRGTPIYTSEGQYIGQALRIHHRVQDVDPELKLYASYLEISNLALGSSLYVPLVFVSTFDSAAPRVNLSVPLKTVEGETWDREPTFIAGRQSRVESLA